MCLSLCITTSKTRTFNSRQRSLDFFIAVRVEDNVQLENSKTVAIPLSVDGDDEFVLMVVLFS